jgi:ubiquitin carboxyl-terminal hydrolase 1
MNTDARRIFSKFDTRGFPDSYQHSAGGQLRDRFSNPTVIVSIVILVATIVYQAAHQHRRLSSLLQRLCDGAVTVIPARVIFAIDRFMNPPLFPTHMLKPQPPTRAAKSDALRRILGIDNGGGIIGSVAQAGRKGLSGLTGTSLGMGAAGDQPAGLGNYNNSCYQNSILQGLASLTPLPAYLSAISLERRLDRSPTRTVDTLRELIAELTDPSSNGRTLWTPKALTNMSTWQQQDAQEYYSKLLDQIDNEIAKAARALKDAPGLDSDRTVYDSSASQHSDDSGYQSLHSHPKSALEAPRLARNPLEGMMAQRVACVNCGYCEGLSMIPFNCLTLTLGNLAEHDLYERLDHYTKVESIAGVECVKCSLMMARDVLKTLAERTGTVPEFQQRLQVLEEALEEEMFDEETLAGKCKITPKMRASSTKTKQVVLARPPPSLVFHINRSGFDEETGFMYKNSAAVRFPLLLDLGPWCLGSTDGQTSSKEGAAPVRDVEQWTLDPRRSMVAGDREPSRITGPIYELRAVVTHQGHHENGHYVCYRKHPFSSSPAMSESEGAEKPAGSASGKSVAADLMDLDDETEPGDAEHSASEADGSWSSQDEPQSQWWRLSDEHAAPVDERTVLAQGGVFMLFYDRVDPNSILVSDANTPVAAERISEDTKMPDMPLVDPAPWRAVPNPSAVREDEEILADSNPPMPFDNSLPLPGIPTPVGGLDEADGQQQPSSSDSDEPPEWLARPVARKPDPAEDQNMDQMPTEFSSPLTQVPEV